MAVSEDSSPVPEADLSVSQKSVTAMSVLS